MSDEKKKKRGIFRYSVLSTSTFSSWRRSSTSGSISQSRASTATTTSSFPSSPPPPAATTVAAASSSSTSNATSINAGTSTTSATSTSSSDAVMVPPLSAPANIKVFHRLVPSKSKFRQCNVCERYFILDYVRRQHCEDVYACTVCGKRVHEGCLDRLANDCTMQAQYVGGIVHNVIMQSNAKIWESPPPTPPPAAEQPAAQPSTPRSLTTSPSVLDKNVHTNNSTTPLLTTTTTSTLDDMTIYSENFCDDLNGDYEMMDYETMTWEDVTIKVSDIDVKQRIGDGRFGVVHFAQYHGDAAVKFVKMDYLKEEERRMEVFTQEIVTAYKNSRHDHIALFYGYVADPLTNQYGIVTNFYQHKTLYHRIHESAEDFEQSWTFQISLQICQAMSYLHKKKILHRDLRSKNILLDNPNRVVVADFALMKLERLEYPKRDYTFCIPNHWLDYLAPEIASNLMLNERREVTFHLDLPFSGESDVYSFGTIFFELLLRKMPTGCDSWEQKLYAKMSGQKAALQRLDTQLQKIDTKLHDLLMGCWSNQPENRPNFLQIVKRITAMMPRKESNKTKRRSTAHENPLF